jgi:hypothetical protein
MNASLTLLLLSAFQELHASVTRENEEGKTEAIAFSNGRISGILSAAAALSEISENDLFSLNKLSSTVICKGSSIKDIEALLIKHCEAMQKAQSVHKQHEKQIEEKFSVGSRLTNHEIDLGE